MVKRLVFLIFFILLNALFLDAAEQAIHKEESSLVAVLTIKGSINPVISDYIEDQLKQLQNSKKYQAVLIQIDTPGGLLSSTRKIIQAMLNSKLPIIVYVSPPGARAASAGFFILSAADYAVMVKESNTGAASPIQISGEDNKKTLKKKIQEDTLAFLRQLLKRKNRPLKPALLTVTHAKSYTAQEALDLKLIDSIANNLNELKIVLQNTQELTKNGQSHILKNISFEKIPFPWHKKLLLILIQPNIVYFLLIIGFYALIFEIFSPGFGLPGILGGTCLILALTGLSLIPVSYSGILFIIIGLALLIAEVYITSYGLLTLGGLASLALGSFLFFDSLGAALSSVSGFLIGLTLALGIMVVLAVSKIMKLKRKESSYFQFKNKKATALEDFNTEGFGSIRLEGEIWQAKNNSLESIIKKGQTVTALNKEGIYIIVQP